MNIITILFYILVVLILAYIAVFKKSTIKHEYKGPIDVSLKDVNDFIRREFLFQLITWLNSGINVKDMSSMDHTSVIISELKNPEILKKKMAAMTSIIVANMSKNLLAEFHAVYSPITGEEIPTIVNYVSRQIMFYIRKVNVDITSMFNENKDQPVDNLLKIYILSIENEIYKDNLIETVTSSGTGNQTANEGETK